MANCDNPDHLRWGQMDSLNRQRMHANLREKQTPVRNKDVEWYLPARQVVLGSGLTLPPSGSGLPPSGSGLTLRPAPPLGLPLTSIEIAEEEDLDLPPPVPRPPQCRPTIGKRVNFSTFGARNLRFGHTWSTAAEMMNKLVDKRGGRPFLCQTSWLKKLCESAAA